MSLTYTNTQKASWQSYPSTEAHLEVASTGTAVWATDSVLCCPSRRRCPPWRAYSRYTAQGRRLEHQKVFAFGEHHIHRSYPAHRDKLLRMDSAGKGLRIASMRHGGKTPESEGHAGKWPRCLDRTRRWVLSPGPAQNRTRNSSAVECLHFYI